MVNKKETKIIFKETTQEIKIRGSNHYRPQEFTKYTEIDINQNNIENNDIADELEKTPFLINDTSDKISLDFQSDNSIKIVDEQKKLNLLDGDDKQELDQNKFESLSKSNQNNSVKLPIPHRKTKFKEKENIVSDVFVDRTLKEKSIQKQNTVEESSLLNTDKDSDIIRKKYSSNYKKGSWGNNFSKKSKNTKTDDVKEEEEKGIYRTSSLKKTKRQKPIKADDDGIVRVSYSSKNKSSTNTFGKKTYNYTEEKLYNYGINRLSEQDYGRHELFKKMKNLQEDEEMINRVLDKLSSQKYLSDNNRIRSFLLSYSRSESVNKTKQRLLQKGFSKNAIEDVLMEMEESGIYKAIQDTETEDDKALNLLIRRFRIFEEDKKDKMVRFLASKGFQYDIITKVMKIFSNGDFDTFDPY